MKTKNEILALLSQGKTEGADLFEKAVKRAVAKGIISVGTAQRYLYLVQGFKCKLPLLWLLAYKTEWLSSLY